MYPGKWICGSSRVATFSLAIALILSGCATTKKSYPPPNDWSIDDLAQGREAGAYREIRTSYNKGLRNEAIEKTQTFEKRYPNSRLLPHVLNFRGLSYFIEKDYRSAVGAFRR